MQTARMCSVTAILAATLMSNTLQGSLARRFIPSTSRLVRFSSSHAAPSRQVLAAIFNRHNHVFKMAIDDDGVMGLERSTSGPPPKRIIVPDHRLTLPSGRSITEAGHHWANIQKSYDLDAQPFPGNKDDQQRMLEDIHNRSLLWASFGKSQRIDEFSGEFCLVRCGHRKRDDKLGNTEIVLIETDARGLTRWGLAIPGQVKLRVGMTEDGWPIAYAALYRLGDFTLGMAAATCQPEILHAQDYDDDRWRPIRDDNGNLGL